MRRAGLDPLSAESGPTGSPQETRGLASFRDIPMIYDAHSKIPAGSIAYRMILSLGFDPILILVLVLLIFPAFFWALGFSQAMTKKTFFVFNRSGAEYMALRIFDEQLVATPLDRKQCEHSGDFLVLKIDDVGGLKATTIDCSHRPNWKGLLP